MEKLAVDVKGIMPLLVKQVADWFEVNVTIKLFGVEVFSFTWPPKNNVESSNILNHES